MQGYDEFPPLNSFKRVLQVSPQSALIYAELWEIFKANSNRISIKKDEIKKIFLISPTLFRNHLLSLGRLEILSSKETQDFFLIDFYESNKI